MATGEQPSFGGLVLRLACKNTWTFFKRRSVEVAATLFSFGIGIPIFVAFYGWAAVTEEFVRVAAFVLAPAGLFLFFSFFWNLCLAADQLVYDAIKQIPAATNASAKALPAVLPKKGKPPINWGPWKARSQFSISAFAKILALDDPVALATSHEAAAYEALIMEEVNNGKVAVIPETYEGFGGRQINREVTEDSEIKKTDAVAWAEGKGFPVAHIK